jgi:hypothetical protein
MPKIFIIFAQDLKSSTVRRPGFDDFQECKERLVGNRQTAYNERIKISFT